MKISLFGNLQKCPVRVNNIFLIFIWKWIYITFEFDKENWSLYFNHSCSKVICLFINNWKFRSTLADQQRLTYISYVWTLNVSWRTSWEWWVIGMDGERERERERERESQGNCVVSTIWWWWWWWTGNWDIYQTGSVWEAYTPNI